MLFIMTSRAHSCGYVAIMVYYCYVVHQSEICNVCLVWNTAHWLEVRPHPLYGVFQVSLVKKKWHLPHKGVMIHPCRSCQNVRT